MCEKKTGGGMGRKEVGRDEGKEKDGRNNGEREPVCIFKFSIE